MIMVMVVSAASSIEVTWGKPIQKHLENLNSDIVASVWDGSRMLKKQPKKEKEETFENDDATFYIVLDDMAISTEAPTESPAEKVIKTPSPVEKVIKNPTSLFKDEEVKDVQKENGKEEEQIGTNGKPFFPVEDEEENKENENQGNNNKDNQGNNKDNQENNKDNQGNNENDQKEKQNDESQKTPDEKQKDKTNGKEKEINTTNDLEQNENFENGNKKVKTYDLTVEISVLTTLFRPNDNDTFLVPSVSVSNVLSNTNEGRRVLTAVVEAVQTIAQSPPLGYIVVGAALQSRQIVLIKDDDVVLHYESQSTTVIDGVIPVEVIGEESNELVQLSLPFLIFQMTFSVSQFGTGNSQDEEEVRADFQKSINRHIRKSSLLIKGVSLTDYINSADSRVARLSVHGKEQNFFQPLFDWSIVTNYANDPTTSDNLSQSSPDALTATSFKAIKPKFIHSIRVSGFAMLVITTLITLILVRTARVRHLRGEKQLLHQSLEYPVINSEEAVNNMLNMGLSTTDCGTLPDKGCHFKGSPSSVRDAPFGEARYDKDII
eukprot:CAMPEP_0194361068 /NCGR_PEP_ID=MMETSP0174-20130528/8584_1 /TAXON_ID=216777 /ORGANISM="Proboscia alata, Strain PI-D3" /LENGTH=547 /DNA_ID=CAMNT_0039133027 /DNA_START=372 /DNA_END=2015 /DNA_ORIENTATION=-